MELRSYSKKELALVYCPDMSVHGAVNKFMGWLNTCTPLVKELEELGYRKTTKQFTIRQVKSIFFYLGEP